MPNRRRGRKARKFRPTRRRRAGRRTQVMVNRTPFRQKSIVAPRYFTTLEGTFQGILDITATQNQSFQVGGNIVGNPFDFSALSRSFSNMTGATLVNAPGAITINQIQPAGFQVLAGIYGNYRVHASQLMVTMTPTAGADVSELNVVPILWDQETATYLQPPNFYAAKSAPYSKNIQVTGNNNIKQNTLINKILSRNILGQSKEQFRTSSAVLMTVGQNPDVVGQEDTAWAWRIDYQKYATGVFTANAAISVKVKYYMEFCNIEQDWPIS